MNVCRFMYVCKLSYRCSCLKWYAPYISTTCVHVYREGGEKGERAIEHAYIYIYIYIYENMHTRRGVWRERVYTHTYKNIHTHLCVCGFSHECQSDSRYSHFHNDCLFFSLKKKLNVWSCERNAPVWDFSTALGTTVFSFFLKKRQSLWKWEYIHLFWLQSDLYESWNNLWIAAATETDLAYIHTYIHTCIHTYRYWM